MSRLALLCFVVMAAAPLAADETDRGGSLTLEPGVLMPAGALAASYDAAPQLAADFDVGINRNWSLIFGGAYSDHQNSFNPQAQLVLAPGWMGFKSKKRIGDRVEVFWDLSGEVIYEKEYIHYTSGSAQNLDGGGAAGAGFDLLLTDWLLLGCESRCHLVIENGEVFPLIQLALRLGLRG